MNKQDAAPGTLIVERVKPHAEQISKAGMKTILVSRYHPSVVALHWLLAVLIIAVLIIAVLVVGFARLAPMRNDDAQKVGVLLIHMSVGMLIFGLTLVRFTLRISTAKPTDATTGSAALDRIAPLTHYAFYLLVTSMAASGLATALVAGLNRSVFQRTGEALPASFAIYPTFAAHFYLALVLAGLLALHVLAAFYHQLVRRDRLLRRIWFGPADS